MLLNRLIHNRFVAMAIVAFSVSWCFHIVEKRSDEKIQQEQAVLSCVIKTTADLQGQIPRLNLRGILNACEGKERK
jgi:hypothetical protein